VDAELATLGAPAAIDAVAPDAILARDVADELAAGAEGAEDVTLWPANPFDSVSLMCPRMRALLEGLTGSGNEVTLCFDADTLGSLDAAQKLGLRDAAVRYGLRLCTGATPQYSNGARAIAALANGRIWASRDPSAGRFGDNWGVGSEAAVVRFSAETPNVALIDKDSLLPKQGDRFREVHKELDGPSMTFGRRFLDFVKPELETLGLWRPG
jgi:hypothetical protein